MPTFGTHRVCSSRSRSQGITSKPERERPASQFTLKTFKHAREPPRTSPGRAPEHQGHRATRSTRRATVVLHDVGSSCLASVVLPEAGRPQREDSIATAFPSTDRCRSLCLRAAIRSHAFSPYPAAARPRCARWGWPTSVDVLHEIPQVWTVVDPVRDVASPRSVVRAHQNPPKSLGKSKAAFTPLECRRIICTSFGRTPCWMSRLPHACRGP